MKVSEIKALRASKRAERDAAARDREAEAITRAIVTHKDPALARPLLERVQHTVEQRNGAATKRAYAGDFERFRAFCIEHGRTPVPADGATIAEYLQTLLDDNQKLKTIERAYAGIAHAQREAGVEWRKPDIVKAFLAGAARIMGRRPSQKAPTTREVLEKLLKTIDRTTLAGKRDATILLLGFAGAFRRSELVAIDVEHLERVPEGLIVTTLFSKTDQEGKGFERGIPSGEEREDLCPVLALDEWLAAAKITAGPIFRGMTSAGTVRARRLSDRAVAIIVKDAAEAAGLDPDRFAGHSLRAGFMTEAAKQGKQLHEIMEQSGHKSESVARGYIRRATLFEKNAAKGLY